MEFQRLQYCTTAVPLSFHHLNETMNNLKAVSTLLSLAAIVDFKGRFHFVSDEGKKKHLRLPLCCRFSAWSNQAARSVKGPAGLRI